MKIRRLNSEGIDGFSQYLVLLKESPKLAPPSWMLHDPKFSDGYDIDIEISEDILRNRLDAALRLNEYFEDVPIEKLDEDVGLWAWLTLLFFDQLCPADRSGSRKVGERSRYIPVFGLARRYYRHLLFGPFSIVRSHGDCPERLLVLLSSPVYVATSETYRLFVENSWLIGIRSVVEVANDLYFDVDKKKLKTGAGNKEKGGCRRLIEFLQQLDCTYDLATLSAERLLSLLPAEFHPFINRQGRLGLE